MALGPVELVVIKFPGNQFKGEIAPAIADLVKSNTIRIIDFVFVSKDAGGTTTRIELSELDGAELAGVDALVDDVSGFVSEDDLARLESMLEPNSSEMIVLFENIWAMRFATAVRGAGGEVVLAERIPHDAIVAAESFAG